MPSDHSQARKEARMRGLGWTFAIVSLFMVVLDNLIVTTALPSICADLGPQAATNTAPKVTRGSLRRVDHRRWRSLLVRSVPAADAVNLDRGGHQTIVGTS
jgi:hypothetical protein